MILEREGEIHRRITKNYHGQVSFGGFVWMDAVCCSNIEEVQKYLESTTEKTRIIEYTKIEEYRVVAGQPRSDGTD